MSQYTLAKSAIADLDEIWLYVARNGSVERAGKLIEAITSKFPLLAAFPEIGRHRPNLGENIRSFPIRDYRIYYRQADLGVRILHVKHARRDERGMTRK